MKLEKAVEALIAQGVLYFAVGGGRGYDMLAAMTVLKFKRQNPALRLAVVMPCKSHDFSWQGHDKRDFEQVLRQADRVMYTTERFYSGCVYKRNRQLAESSGWCVCYLDQNASGTAYTVSYAQSVGVRIINLATV
ncbi:MAG: DUF1273 domain-containing protein [Oscillospiraceae bacterium]|nr:DUF1273 domain-containing protein [Oscillospiraceae bacterium]